MWISHLDAGLGALYLVGQAARQRRQSLRGEGSRVAEVQPPTTVAQQSRKRPTRPGLLVGTAVYRAIAAVGHQASHSRLRAARALGSGLESVVTIGHRSSQGYTKHQTP